MKDAAVDSKHHEQTSSAQRSFVEKVEALFRGVLKEIGNPFQEDSADVLQLDTKNIADPAVADLVETHHQRGQEKFESFMKKTIAHSTNQSRRTRWLSSSMSRLPATLRRKS